MDRTHPDSGSTSPAYLSAEKIAEMLSLKTRYVADRLCRRKGFPAPRRVGRLRLWPTAEVLAWIEERKEV